MRPKSSSGIISLKGEIVTFAYCIEENMVQAPWRPKIEAEQLAEHTLYMTPAQKKSAAMWQELDDLAVHWHELAIE